MPRIILDPALQIAFQQHQSGQLAEAEEGYRRVLTREPGHPQALHFLGVLAAQNKCPAVAIQLMQRAVAIDPGYAEAYRDLAKVFSAEKRLDESAEAYRKAL